MRHPTPAAVDAIGVYLDVEVDWPALEGLIGNAYHSIADRGR